MAFFPPGDVSALDRFARADGPVYAGDGAALWDDITFDGSASGLIVSSGTLAATSGGSGLTNESVADFLRVWTATATGGGGPALLYRVQSPGASRIGYFFSLQGTTWKAFRWDAGVPTEIASEDVSSSLSAGQRVALFVVGNRHQLYLGSSVSFQQDPIFDFVDGTYTGAGQLGIEPSSTAWKFDNYSSGDLVAPTTPVTVIVDADHPDASDERSRVEASNPATPLATPQAAGWLVRATADWADTILIKPSTEGNADASNLDDPDLYPALDYRYTDRSPNAAGWPFGDNDGNMPIRMIGDPDADARPKVFKLNCRGLTNWEFEGIQWGYDVGSGKDYSTLGQWERITDLKFIDCLWTGGAAIVSWWAGFLTLEDCTTHSPLPPDGGNPSFHDGAGFRVTQLPNDSEGGADDHSVGQFFATNCEFSNIRGDDAITIGGSFDTDPLWDIFDCQLDGCLFYNVTEGGEGGNPVFHCDSLQILSVPRTTVRRCIFIGTSDAIIASDGINGTVTFENNLCVQGGSPFQMQGTREVIIRHNTFFPTTSLRDASLLFFTRASLPEKTLATIVNNVIGGFYMQATTMASYFREGSVIANNLVITNPGGVTPWGTHLPGIPEFGNSPRLDSIPNDTLLQGELPRVWELANTPLSSPGIGQGQDTDIETDLFGRPYTSPPDVGCLQSDPATPVVAIARPPYVAYRSPAPNATGVAASTGITVGLYPKPGETIDAATLTSGNFTVQDPAGLAVPVILSISPLDEDGVQELTANPVQSIEPLLEGDLFALVQYAVTLGGIADTEGSELETTAWSFRVAGTGSPAIGGGSSALEPFTGVAATNRNTNGCTLTFNSAQLAVDVVGLKTLRTLLDHLLTETLGSESDDTTPVVSISPLT